MNYFKFQESILKNASAKMQGKKSERLFYYEKDNNVFFSEGHYIVSIPKAFIIIDYKKADVCEIGDFIGKIVVDEPSEIAIKTNSIHKTDKAELQVFKIQRNDEKVYIDTRYLKDFEKRQNRFEDVNLIYKCASKVSPLYIYNSDNFLGLILPVNISNVEL